MSSQNLVREASVIKSGACEGKRGREKRKRAQKMDLRRNLVERIMGLGLGGEWKMGLMWESESAIDEEEES